MNDLIIREASLADAPRLLEIYSPYVTDTVITFEYEVPSQEEFQSRIETIKRRYPYLVCEEQGRVIGYAYADTYMIRPAYDWCAEVSIYVDRDCRGRGAGQALYRELFESFYPGQAEMIPGFWMPNPEWEGCQVDDPSARVLSNYGASGE